MVVGGSQQETLDPGFVLFGTRHQDVPVILREMVLPYDSIPCHPASQSKTLPLGYPDRTRVGSNPSGSTSSLNITSAP
ncbi:unnamed protein product [Schistosoma margrebowiei]|uniref:Uncharacterized protein n=1 Tax=Schistosoma margrebowiei TaxID=48269 RepID=A0A183M184_9TREM|nr:unnamed protein product [Schistosoma margrebowiei]